jgi:hypothetical protein
LFKQSMRHPFHLVAQRRDVAFLVLAFDPQALQF